MARTNSIAFPNMFDSARNKVSVLEDVDSVVNRTRLMILTEPTELFNEPQFGVGLKRYLWQYNNGNQQAIIKDRIVEQLRIFEPCVIPEETQFADGLMFSGSVDENEKIQDYNRLKMTVAVKTVFGDHADISFEDLLIGGRNNG